VTVAASISLLDPAHHLPRAKWLFADLGEETGEPFSIEIEQVYRHQRE